ncbi:protein trichome birefringence-like 19 [Vitis vinifera]|nr:protein trichome birefringence-like 19 [Vitis vinifera]
MELLPTGKKLLHNATMKLILVTIALILLAMIPLNLFNNFSSPWPSPVSTKLGKKCDIFRGRWVQFPKGPYYTNVTCHHILDQHNCMKFGRPDTEFLKWRWKPDECELPFFDAAQFLELVRGKSMAFMGDSLARNQMESLLCLLASEGDPIAVSNIKYPLSKSCLYTDYNFTVASFWSPYLVKDIDAKPTAGTANSLMNVFVDEAHEAWMSQIEKFSYVIVSAGIWFFRPQVYYENGNIVGCRLCHKKNVTNHTALYGYRKAFQTTFRTLLRLKNFKGVTFLRTVSPSHFENGEWNTGGNCVRTKPVSSKEMKLEGLYREMYSTQVEELKTAARLGRKRGLKFRLLDTTEAMVMRPDGHPSYYGKRVDENVTITDCVHWCLPGPIDTWNEFLLQMLKMEGDSSLGQ